MDLIKGKHLAPFAMFPAVPETCPECAVEHGPEQPHNQQSLFYQYKFFNDNGRWPTWEDAMAHCDDETKHVWRVALREHDVEI